MYDWKTLEKSLNCLVCGYYHEVRILIDRKKSTPGYWIWKLDEAGYPIYRSSKKHGNGVVSVHAVSGRYSVKPFKHPPTEQEIRRARGRIMTDDRIDAAVCYITRWDAVEGQVVVVYGQIPPVNPLLGSAMEAEIAPLSPGFDQDENNKPDDRQASL